MPSRVVGSAARAADYGTAVFPLHSNTLNRSRVELRIPA